MARGAWSNGSAPYLPRRPAFDLIGAWLALLLILILLPSGARAEAPRAVGFSVLPAEVQSPEEAAAFGTREDVPERRTDIHLGYQSVPRWFLAPPQGSALDPHADGDSGTAPLLTLNVANLNLVALYYVAPDGRLAPPRPRTGSALPLVDRDYVSATLAFALDPDLLADHALLLRIQTANQLSLAPTLTDVAHFTLAQGRGLIISGMLMALAGLFVLIMFVTWALSGDRRFLVFVLLAVPLSLAGPAALGQFAFLFPNVPPDALARLPSVLTYVVTAGLILGFFAIVQPAPLPWHLRRAWISLAALSLLMAPLGMTGIHAVSGQFNNAAQGVFCVFVLLNGPQQWSRTSPLGRVALAYLLTTSLLGLGMVTRTWFPHWASFSVVYFWPMMLMTQSAMLIAVLIIGGRHLAELPRQQQQLEQAQQARERLATLARDFASLLSVVSHEIRNPASALRLVAANLGRGAVSAAEAAQDLRRLSVHLADIVSAMQRQRVAFAPEDGATDFQYDPAEKLAQVRGALVERIDPERLHVVLEDGVGPGSHLCNGARLGLILTNLLDNAFKYGGTGQVRLHLVSTPERLLVEVWDAGAGLAPTEVDRLFEQFWRSPRHQHIPGWGLGLWACQSAVESLGGTIRYESRQPSGASFRVEIRRTTQQDRQDT